MGAHWVVFQYLRRDQALMFLRTTNLNSFDKLYAFHEENQLHIHRLYAFHEDKSTTNLTHDRQTKSPVGAQYLCQKSKRAQHGHSVSLN